MKIFIMFHGIPGSGKSTIAQELVDQLAALGVAAVRANRDDTRFALFGDDYFTSDKNRHSNEVRVTEHVLEVVEKAQSDGVIPISDDTNFRVRTARSFREVLTEGTTVVHVFVDIDPVEAKRRMQQRAANGGLYVPETVIDSMVSKFYTKDATGVNRKRQGMVIPGDLTVEVSELQENPLRALGLEEL